MIKVMIVDDEILVRLALRSAIDWETHGLNLVAEAEDGEEAISNIEKYRPHIVIIDISMPIVSGIEVIKDTKDKYPNIEFLVLSCHNEYEYVREAMKLGAVDYILKLSMDMNELMRSICQIRDRIIKEEMVKINDNPVENHQSWKKFILGILNNETCVGDLEELGSNIETTKFRLVVIEADKKSDVTFQITKEVSRSFQSILENTYGQEEQVVAIDIEVGKYLILFKYKDSEECNALDKEYNLRLSKIIELTAGYLELDIACGVSKIVDGYKNIKEAYVQAYSALKCKFYSGKRSVNLYQEKTILENNIINSGKYNALLCHINALDKQEINNSLEELFETLAIGKRLNPKVIKKYLHEVLMYLHKGVTDIFEEPIEFKSLQDGYHKIDEALYLSVLKNEMQDCIECFWKEFEQICNTRYRKEVIMAKKYIQLNYKENINITKISEYVNLSPDYFSHTFKKETGVSFSQYLNEIRIEKAKLLMNGEKLKIYEIAYKVGYENESYFIRKFKEILGITPLEYSKQMKE